VLLLRSAAGVVARQPRPVRARARYGGAA